MVDYMVRQASEQGTPWHSIARHMLGLRHGLPGARRWRQVWSDHRLKDSHPLAVMKTAHERSDHFAIDTVASHA
jgi:tRNA-dihydrouridine synthase A